MENPKKLWTMCSILALVFAILPSPIDSQEGAYDSWLNGASARENRTFHPHDPLGIRAYEEMLPFGEDGDRLSTEASGDNWNVDLVGRWAFGTCLAVAVKGDMAYFGNGDYLEIAEFSEPANPSELGKILLPGAIRAVVVAGNYAYVCLGLPGIRVIDIHDPATPTEVGSYRTAGRALDIVLSGSLAYVADGGLRILDISNPTNPTEVGHLDTPGYAGALTVSGAFAYVIDGDLRVIDVSNPASPLEVGCYDVPRDLASDIALSGTYAYVSISYEGMIILDISNPTNPTEMGHLDTRGSATALTVSGAFAYVTDGALWVIDISNPASPREVGRYGAPGGVEVAISGTYAYIAGRLGLRVFDISNPTDLSEAGHFETRDAARAVSVSGDYAYVADGYAGLRVIDISSPTNPREVGAYTDIPPLWGGAVKEVVVSSNDDYVVPGEYAYLVSPFHLNIIYLGVPEKPVGFSRVAFTTSGSGIAVSENYAYLPWTSAFGLGLRVLDVSDPMNPVQVATKRVNTKSAYCTGLFDSGMSVTHHGDYAYATINCTHHGHTSREVGIFDVSTPADPIAMGLFNVGGNRVTVSTNHAYVAEGSAGLSVIDISNPESPFKVAQYDTPGYVSDVAISGKYAYIADGSGLRVIDISNPVKPRPVGYYETGDFAVRVTVSGDYAYVADNSDGLYILRFDLPVVLARVRITPKTLNLESKGRWVKARIELPEPYDARDVDMSSVFLNDMVLAAQQREDDDNDDEEIDDGDHHGDGDDSTDDRERDVNPVEKGEKGEGREKRLKVRFPWRAVADFLPEGGAVEIKVSGWVGNAYFEGVDRIRVIQTHGGPSLIAEELLGVPESFLLHQNYPNPFNPTTTITYSIAKDADVELLLYDVHGALVRTLVQEHLKSNSYKIRWDGKDNVGNDVSTGVYFYRLRAGTFTSTKKMVLLR